MAEPGLDLFEGGGIRGAAAGVGLNSLRMDVQMRGQATAAASMIAGPTLDMPLPWAQGEQYETTLTETVTLVDALTRSTGAVRFDAVLAVSDTDLATQRAFTEAAAFIDSISKLGGKVATESTALADTVEALKIILKVLTEALVLTDVLTRSTTTTKQEAIALQDSVTKLTTRLLLESAQVVDTVAKNLQRRLTEAITLQDTIENLKVFVKTLSEAVGLIQTFSKQATKNLGETLVLTDSRNFNITRRLEEILQVQANTTKLTSLKAFVEAITLQQTFSKTPGKTFQEVTALQESIKRDIAKVIVEVVGAADSIAKAIQRAFLELVALIDAILADILDPRPGDTVIVGVKDPLPRLAKPQLNRLVFRSPLPRVGIQRRRG
jgi:hypothetical protein